MGDMSTLNAESLRKALQTLRNVNDLEIEMRGKRRLKDHKKLNTFLHKVEDADLDANSRLFLKHTVQKLADGYYLVLGKYMYELTIKELSEWSVPEEVLSNIYLDSPLS